MTRKRQKREKNPDYDTSLKQQKRPDYRGRGGKLEVLTGLGSQVALGVLFVLFMALCFRYLDKNQRAPAVWCGFGAWVSVGLFASLFILERLAPKTPEARTGPPFSGAQPIQPLPPETKTEPATGKVKRAPETQAADSHREKKSVALGANTTPPAEHQTFRERIEQYTFSLGGQGMHVSYDAATLEKGPVEPFNFGNFRPVRMYVENGKFFADCTIYGGPGLPPVDVKKNEFVIRPPNWDRNFSPQALEIVESNQSPVFQMIYKTPSHIAVNGIFPFPGGVLVATESGTTINPAPGRVFVLQRIFKYPSWQHPGDYEQGGPPKER